MLRFNRSKLGIIFTLCVGAIGLTSCANQSKKIDAQLQNMSAIELLDNAKQDISVGNRKAAAVKLKALNDKYSYSKVSQQSLLLTAYNSYQLGKYDEAVQMASRYINLYPEANDLDYAYYVVAVGYVAQIPSVQKDQVATIKAVEWLQELIKRYPRSKYSVEAREKLAMARNQLAGKEMSIGRFYMRQQSYIGALNRFSEVVKQYSDTPQIEEALARLVEVYYALGLVPSAQNAAAILGRNYPASSWYKASYQLLRRGGYVPQLDDGSSWLSQKFRG